MAAKLVTEFVGTFFLVLTIGLSVSQASVAPFAPLAIGSVLMVMVYMGGHISGAHYNPAVTLALFLRGATKASDIVPYWVAQIGGSIVAALAVSFIVAPGENAANYFGPFPGEGYSVGGVGPWLIEILFTFALALVIMNVATSSSTSGNSYFGLAIGFTVLAGAFAGGGISGGAFNPAVGIGPNLIKGTLGAKPEVFAAIPLHVVGPIIGAVLAVPVFKMQEAFTESEKS